MTTETLFKLCSKQPIDSREMKTHISFGRRIVSLSSKMFKIHSKIHYIESKNMANFHGRRIWEHFSNEFRQNSRFASIN